MVSAVAMQLRHFRNANPTPTLNPPMEWAATVSATSGILLLSLVYPGHQW